MKDYLAVRPVLCAPFGDIDQRMSEDELLLQRCGVAYERIKESHWERDSMRRHLLVDDVIVQTYEVKP